MKSAYNKTIFVIVGILVIFSLVIGMLISRRENLKEKEFKFMENNPYNSFTRTTVLDSEMVNMYLYDFYKLVNNDIEKAYSLLDEEFKQSKFSTLASFQTYMKNLNLSSIVESYSVDVINDNYVYRVKVKPNINLTFYTTGVMEYTVTIN